METINQNSEVMKRLLEIFKKSIPEGVPNQLSSVIAPVVDVSPEPVVKNVRLCVSDSASANLLTTSATKTTYLTSLSASISKDVNSTAIYTWVYASLAEQGASEVLLEMRYEPLTAQSNLHKEIVFKHPIKLKKASNIGITNSTAIASLDVSLCATYYEVADN